MELSGTWQSIQNHKFVFAAGRKNKAQDMGYVIIYLFHLLITLIIL